MNVQGLSGKEALLEVECNTYNLTFLCASEHWLTNGESNTIPGFYCASKFSRKTHIRGGSAVYVRESFANRVRQREDIVGEGVEMHFEVSSIEVTLSQGKLVIMSIYRSNNPSSNINIFFEKLERVLLLAGLPGNDVILAGDLNINRDESNPHSRRLGHLLQAFGLLYTTNQFTRITDTSATKIDYVITNITDNMYKADVFPSNVSDHECILFKFMTRHRTGGLCYKKRLRLINERQVACFLDDLEGESWSDVYGCSHPVQSLQIFMRTFLLYFNCCFPEKLITVTKKKTLVGLQMK